MSDAPMRIVLADDHPIVLGGLTELFQQHPGFEVVRSCLTAKMALDTIRSRRVDLLVLDLRMSGQSGLDVLRALSDAAHPCRTVVLTAAVSDTDAVEAIRLGARGLLLKECSADELIDCARRVHDGELYIDRSTMGRALEFMMREEAAGRTLSRVLTPKELEVVRLAAQGLMNREIGRRLLITSSTVKIHLHSVYKKLGVSGRPEMLQSLQERGLV